MELVKYLVENGADINAKNNDGETALMKSSANHENIEIVKHLVENGADVNDKDNNGETALMIASAEFKNSGVVKYLNIVVEYLVENGADVNAKNNNGETALMRASGNNDMEMVKYLVEHGADVNAKDNNGKTALMRASEYGNIEIVKYLVKNGANINVKDNNGETALIKSSAQLKYLIEEAVEIELVKKRRGERGALVTSSPSHLNSHLKARSIEEILETIKYLVENGADVNTKNKEVKTAIDFIGHDEEEIIKIFMEAGAK